MVSLIEVGHIPKASIPVLQGRKEESSLAYANMPPETSFSKVLRSIIPKILVVAVNVSPLGISKSNYFPLCD